MTTTTQEQIISRFFELNKKISSYTHALNVLHWDLRTKAPRKGAGVRSEVHGILAGEQFKLSTSSEMAEYLQALSEPSTLDNLDTITRGAVLEMKKEYDQFSKVPIEVYQDFVTTTSQAETIWEEARAKNDFLLFRPYLERVVSLLIQMADYRKPNQNRYETLLNTYEPDMTVAKLDEMFATLRDKTVPLLHAINESPNRPDISFLLKDFDEAKQESFSTYVLERIGYDFQAGRLDRSVHPFCTSFAPGDVRLTTRFDKNDFRVAFFGCVHEAGHGMYEQNIMEDLFGTLLCDGTSMGIHESQSRYWENMVGRSLPFWKHFYTDLTKEFPTQFAGVSVEDYYRAVNQVEPSLIRTEADELTYNLHVIIRYEIEKALISQTIEVGDLPRIWNEKMKEYLDIDVPDDAHGVLQDVHWAGGSFGYFPTYSLGNVYAAQFAHTMRQQISGYDELIGNGDFAPILHWLKENIYQYGKLKSPNELVTGITGEEANATYLVKYLETKYKEIYNL